MSDRFDEKAREIASKADDLSIDDIASLIAAALRSTDEAARKESAQICEGECEKRLETVKNGHEHAAILLGEASGATACARAIRARGQGVRAGLERCKTVTSPLAVIIAENALAADSAAEKGGG